jgi:hypothetical protein
LAVAAPERQERSRNASGRRAAAGGLGRRRDAMVGGSMCVEVAGGTVSDVASDGGVGGAGEVYI